MYTSWVVVVMVVEVMVSSAHRNDTRSAISLVADEDRTLFREIVKKATGRVRSCANSFSGA